MPGLYIHIPFCKKRCYYCDFTTYTGLEGLMPDYVKALEKEVRQQMQGKQAQTIFIGGGTPTSLDDASFAHLMAIVKSQITSPEQEVTMEANPESLSLTKVRLMKEAGINRVSMGLQSTDDLILKNIGRIHDYATFLKSYSLLRQEGFTNLSFDLITALPGQDQSVILDTIEKSLALAPEHVSVYSMILEEGTPFYKKVEEGQLQLTDDETDRQFQDLFRQRLEEAGYHRYEISNYARTGLECRHNLNYWDLGEFIGCGVAAAGFSEGLRWINTPSVSEYIHGIESGEDVSESVHRNSREDTMEEFVFMGLRKTAGISMEQFFERFGESFDSVYPGVCDRFIANGLMVRQGDRLYLTTRGLDLSNYILSDFILTSPQDS